MLDQYIYISRNKLATYAPQILDGSLLRKEGRKLSVELGFDIQLLKGKVALETQPLSNLVPMVKLVERYLESKGALASPDSGKDWILGELGMKAIRIGENKGLFALIGKYHDCVLLLIGSQSHTNFTGEAQSLNTGFSHFHIIEQVLFDNWVRMFQESTDKEFDLMIELTDNEGNLTEELGNFELAANIYELYHMAKTTTFRVQFLARRLFFGQSTRTEAKTCAIYSPVYVIQK